MASLFPGVILVASVIVHIFNGIIVSSFGMLYNSYMETFNTNSATAGWTAAMQMFSSTITGLFCGPVIDRYGCRTVAIVGCLVAAIGLFFSAFAHQIYILYLGYGIGYGMGLSMIHLPSNVIVQRWYDRWRAVAAALSMSGMPVGSMIGGPLTQTLNEVYGWRGTHIIYSGLTVQALICVSLYRLPLKSNMAVSITKVETSSGKQSNNKEFEDQDVVTSSNQEIQRGTKNNNIVLPQKKRKRTFFTKIIDLSLFTNRKLICFYIGDMLIYYSLLTMISHVPNRALYMGIHPDRVKFLPTVSGIGSAVGSIAGGVIGNTKWTKLHLQYSICAILSGCVFLMTGLCGNHFVWNVVTLGSSSFMFGTFLCIKVPFVRSMVGLNHLATAMGILGIFLAISGLTAVPFAGWLFDISGNYNLPFFVTGSITMTGGFVILISQIISTQLLTEMDNLFLNR